MADPARLPGALRAAALDELGAAVVTLAEAEAEYRRALLAAVGLGCSYAETGRAAGVTRQAVHDFVTKAKAAERRRRADRRSAAAAARAAAAG